MAKHISECIEEYLEGLLMGRGYIPTADEFNKKMHECIEYKKLVKLKDDLKWFKGKVAGKDVTQLLDSINKRIGEIPKESRNFDTEVHGQTTKL